MSLVPVDPTNEVAVIGFLEAGVAALSEALEATDIPRIVNIKAQAKTVETATRQLDLSKESQDHATELVRRSEYDLGRALRKGQAEGTVRKHGEKSSTWDRHGGVLIEHENSKASPQDFATRGELYGATNSPGILALADVPEADFEAALKEAKEEGDLSRANVARKASVPPTQRRKPLTDSARDAGWDLRKAVERLQRIAADDRFAANKAQMAPHLRSHLENAIEVCHDLLDRIN